MFMLVYVATLAHSLLLYYRETLLSMAFYKWWREAQLSQDVRMLERVVRYIHYACVTFIDLIQCQ